MSRHKVAPATWLDDPDPWLRLTPRQREVIGVLLSFDGNRSRTARQLGINVAAVQQIVRLAARVGYRAPAIARRGPDLAPRRRVAA